MNETKSTMPPQIGGARDRRSGWVGDVAGSGHLSCNPTGPSVPLNPASTSEGEGI
jgi:hypothetical protein